MGQKPQNTWHYSWPEVEMGLPNPFRTFNT